LKKYVITIYFAGSDGPRRSATFINNVLYYKNDPYRNCPEPFVLIGMQCLFFSQPYEPWGMQSTWEESYANYYDAVTICRSKTKKYLNNNTKNKSTSMSSSYSSATTRHNSIEGFGDLASEIINYEEALKYCNDRVRNPGGCSPSLLHKKGKCRQWSPIDGKIVEITCDWRNKMRFVCEFKRQ
jgi:hypothetical protein